jgi:hypothetical protein
MKIITAYWRRRLLSAELQSRALNRLHRRRWMSTRAALTKPSSATRAARPRAQRPMGAGGKPPHSRWGNAAERAVRWREPGHRAQSGRINRRLKNQPVAVTELRVDLRRGRGKPRFTSGFCLLRL